MKQMINKTTLETYKGHIPTGKRFKIIRISRGKIQGVPEIFNKYIALRKSRLIKTNLYGNMIHF